MIRGFLRQGRILRPSTVHSRLRYYSDDKKPTQGLDFGALNDEIGSERENSSNENNKSEGQAINSDLVGSSSSAHETPAKPWYLRDQPEAKEEPVNIDLGLPDGAMNDIAKQLARDAIYDIKYIPEQDIVIGSGKSSRHIYKAGREIMSVLKHQHDVLPTAEGLFKKNAQRMSYRRMLKKARKQNLEFPDSEWVVIDSQMGFHVHIFTAEKRELVNLEDLYKFEMDEEEVEISPEDFEWAEKGRKNVIDGDEFLSGQQNSDPFLRSDSITGLPKKPSNNPFDGGIGSGQRRSMHTSAPAEATIAVNLDGESAAGKEDESKVHPSIVPVFMYENWAAKGEKDKILAKLDDLQPHEDRKVLVLRGIANFLKLSTTGFNDVPQAVEELFEVFSPSDASNDEWRVAFQALRNAYYLNHKCVPTQALVDFLVSQQAAGAAVVNKQVQDVIEVTIDSQQYETVGVTSVKEWNRVVDAKVQVIKQLIESFGLVTPARHLGTDKFIRVMARALTQRTSASFGLKVPAQTETTKHPIDGRLRRLESGNKIKNMNRMTLFVFFAAYANAYDWKSFFNLVQRCHKETKTDTAHVLMVTTLVLHSRDETAYYRLMESGLDDLRDAKGNLPLDKECAEKLTAIMDHIDPEHQRFQHLRRQTSTFA
ncbi:ATPase synthesis protein 25 [Yarrowia sp. B02]|nr:ATPase synthesis protein 25 [Yarrowia sp. B02]